MEIDPLSAAARWLAIATILSAPLRAQESGSVQIAWASDAFANNLMADGTTTFGGSAFAIQFELGTFSVGFDPLSSPQSDWAANWIVLQATAYDTVEQQFINTATLADNAAPFAVNSPAYIWGYNTKDTSGGIAEWIVISATSWKWPSIDSPLPVSFSVSDIVSESEVLMGGVNGDLAGVPFHMQLEAVAIPEPAAFGLCGLSLLVLGTRRRR